MICKKCKKEIPDNSAYCNLCGRKQTAAPKKRTRKRAHGTGSITKDTRYKNPYIVHAPAKSFTGERLYLGSFPDMASAQAALEEYIKNGRPQYCNATLEKVYELWSSSHFKTIQQAGISLYSSLWKHYKPLYTSKIADLRTADFQTIVDAATSRSAANVLKTIAVLLCRFACENDIIAKNYAEYIKLPKAEKSEKVIFTSEQIATLWQHTESKGVQIILMMIYTGFRIGEIIALTPQNIHFNDGYIIGGEKTEAGKNRIVPIPPSIPEIADFLKEWCKGIPENECIFKGYNKSTFRNVFFYDTLIDLHLLDAQKTSRNQYTFVQKNHLTPHSTRHTFASLSASSGMTPENLQKIIGHANYQTTANIYIHKDIGQLKSDMAKLTK